MRQHSSKTLKTSINYSIQKVVSVAFHKIMFLNLYQYFKLNDYIHDLVDLIVCLFFYILFFIRKLKQTQVKWVFFFRCAA